MATKTFRQELPPPGGYGPVDWTRTHPKKYFKGWHLFAGIVVVHLCGWYVHLQTKREVKKWTAERNGGNFAIKALIKAERDRAYLKVLHSNRDEEERLMKDVPGWVTGTYFGDPVFHTTTEDEWRDPTINEYFMHAREWDIKYHMNFFKFM